MDLYSLKTQGSLLWEQNKQTSIWKGDGIIFSTYPQTKLTYYKKKIPEEGGGCKRFTAYAQTHEKTSQNCYTKSIKPDLFNTALTSACNSAPVQCVVFLFQY